LAGNCCVVKYNSAAAVGIDNAIVPITVLENVRVTTGSANQKIVTRAPIQYVSPNPTEKDIRPITRFQIVSPRIAD
jgi:hypothetical protein